ncbi:ATP-dependent RNA helicase [Agilicoccus flavus]|uniref:ATP-dependent RNA helicase n=1 Tax=Agilicoccus flavus TaxID=2775968 RepID=UPI001CF65FF7|nr:ATP-dependent helicase C-terminal domain-containing protein [Agilicoccus flavus]
MSSPFDLARIGAGLPFADSAGALAAAVAERGVAVVQAPPGTGKTTLGPPIVAGVVPGRIVVTQPRRIAVRAAARRLAALTGTAPGDVAGFTVRGERRVGQRTRVEFCTPGVLLRRLLSDPDLPGVGAVVLDEVHERGLETDLLVGMLVEVRELRDDLGLVAMSATLDAPRFAALLGTGTASRAAPVIDCPSALHPLTIRWAPGDIPRTDARGVSRAFLDHVARVTLDAHARAAADLGLAQAPDALVFVPGVAEVAHVARRLAEATGGVATGKTGTATADGSVEILELHGRLGPAAQDRVTGGRAPGEPARIVVSTSLAESSLTVPGVRLVVDAGLAREPRRDAARGMSGLVTVAASRDAAVQRAGRAARLGPGIAVRCYDETTFAALPAHVTPEIAAADLVGAALTLACWGSPRGEGLALPDAPPAGAIADAERVLRGLGAADADGRVTALGRRLARVPADPRLARALLDGAAVVGAPAAAAVVAALSDDHRPEGADLPRLLADLGRGRAPGAARWRDETRRLAGLAKEPADDGRSAGWAPDAAGAGRDSDDVVRSSRSGGSAPDTARAGRDSDAVGLVVALAFPDRMARRVGSAGGDGVYLLASGTRAAVPNGPLTGHEWLAVADVARAEGRAAAGTGAVVRSAAPLSEQARDLAGAELLTDEVRAQWRTDAAPGGGSATSSADAVGGRVVARRVRALGAIELSSAPVRPSREVARAAVDAALARWGLRLFAWSPAADGLRRRLALLHAHVGEPWPDVRDAALLRRADEWLGPEIDALADGGRADRIDLLDPLRRLLPWPDAARLDDLAPQRLTVASGSRVRIDYPAVPASETAVQEAAATSAAAATAAPDPAAAADPASADAGTRVPADDAAAVGPASAVGRPVVAVKLQECFGWAATPTVAGVPILFHLLSPAGRPLAITDDLASFWAGPYAQVRAEMRGRYPKHPWPEDPWSAPATARTRRAGR